MELLNQAQFSLAALVAGLMGGAVQRGGTCMVAAVDELVTQRRALRAAAMLEAGLWVGGIIGFALLLGLPVTAPEPMPILFATYAGAVLLGLGAYINRACVIGTVARLGSGEWAFVFTPIGFLVGCLLVYRSGWPVLAAVPASVALPLAPLQQLMIALAILTVWRIMTACLAGSSLDTNLPRRIWRDVCSPRGATCMIGICFALLLLFAGPWTYPQVLAEFAESGFSLEAGQHGLLFFSLLAGAVIGGQASGVQSGQAPTLPQCLRCFGGGAIMAVGSLMVPGSNDGLLLLGLPLLQSHAAASLLVMCTTIAAVQLATMWISALSVGRAG